LFFVITFEAAHVDLIRYFCCFAATPLNHRVLCMSDVTDSIYILMGGGTVNLIHSI